MTGEQWVLECGRGWEEAWRNFWEKNLCSLSLWFHACTLCQSLPTVHLKHMQLILCQWLFITGLFFFNTDYSVVRKQSTWMATAKRTHYILFNMPNDPFSYPLRPYRRTECSRSFRVSWKNERRRASHSPEIWTVWAVGGAWLSTSVPRHLLENN